MSKSLDVLIINPSALSQIYQNLSSQYAAIEPPIWAGLIANHLRSKKYSVAILDCEGLGLTVDETIKQIPDYNAKLIAIVVYGQQPSASTQNMHASHILTQLLKEHYPNKKIILIGGHCSALPKRTLVEEKADFVCQGEGPSTLNALLQTNLETTSQLKKVPGLWFKDKDTNEVINTPSASLIPQENLSTELPGIAWDLLPMKNYRAHNWHCFGSIEERQPYASIYTSLGCPFRCTFCCINAPFGGSKFRYWDPQFMVGQFELLAKEYNITNIKIADEMFVLKENHFMELCRLIKERGLKFNIWAYSRIDTIKQNHLEALKDAGVNWVALGIESKSKFVRDGVSKGRFQDDDIYKVVKQIQNADISVIGNYIFGLPDDNYATMQETLDMALDLNCEMSNFYSAMAYPGSQLYEMAIKGDWKLPETWLGYSQHAFESLPLATKHLEGGEVLAFRDLAWDVYFNDKTYLDSVLKKFGKDTYDHIRSLSKISLDRKYRIEPKIKPRGRV